MIKVKDEELVSHKKIVKAQKHAEPMKNVTLSVPTVSAAADNVPKQAADLPPVQQAMPQLQQL